MSRRLTVLSLGAAAMLAATAPVWAEHSPFAAIDPSPTTVTKSGECEVRCVDAHACCADSEKVIGELKEMITAYTHGDLSTYEKYLDDRCSMFDEKTKALIAGKTAILEHLKQSFALHAPGGSQPLVSYTIDQPMAKVTNDTCVVTFFATKVIGGAHPHSERAHITDVFVKRTDGWKKLHWSGTWETVAENN